MGMMFVCLIPDEDLACRTFVHTQWVGISLADCFFPCFLFLSGVSLGINAETKIWGERWLANALKRGVYLALIGMLCNHFFRIWSLLFNPAYGFEQFFHGITHFFRPFGVLQRIGFAHVLGLCIFHFARTIRNGMMAAFAILLATTAGFFLYNPAAPFAETDNISIFVDQALQGTNHNALRKIFDPEGMYGNITAIASFIFGIVAGMQLKVGDRMASVQWGCALGLTGWLASYVVIVSKPLWTAPYVLILTGAFMILLPALDAYFHRTDAAVTWAKLPVLLGANSLLTYLTSTLVCTLLLAAKVGDTSLYHFLWFKSIYSEQMPALSCHMCAFFFSILSACIVCLIVRLCNRAAHGNALLS